MLTKLIPLLRFLFTKTMRSVKDYACYRNYRNYRNNSVTVRVNVTIFLHRGRS